MNMKKIKNVLLLFSLTVVAMLSLQSCGDDEPYFGSPVAGRWELVEVDGYPVVESEVCEFIFYSDGTGVYGQYQPYPQWNESSIAWELDYAAGGAEYLYVYPGYGQMWRYLVRLYPTEMELTDLDTGQRLLFSEY